MSCNCLTEDKYIFKKKYKGSYLVQIFYIYKCKVCGKVDSWAEYIIPGHNRKIICM